jgi:predicted DNA-binding protein
MERTNIYLTKPQLEKLRKLAIESGLTVAELVRRAIDKYLESR